MLLLSHFRLIGYIPTQNKKLKKRCQCVTGLTNQHLHCCCPIFQSNITHFSQQSNCFDSDMNLRTFILFLKLANCFSFKPYSSVGTYWTTFKCLMTQKPLSHSYIRPSKYSEFTKYLQCSEVFNLHLSLTLMRPIIKF